MHHATKYPVILRPLADEDGGGWIAIVPDLPGCISDGATGDEAFKNVVEAIDEWEEAASSQGESIPLPDSFMAKMQFGIPDHLRPQIEHLVEEIRASYPEPVSRSQIMAGLMARFAQQQMGNLGADA
jgi:antitoxin HicB